MPTSFLKLSDALFCALFEDQGKKIPVAHREGRTRSLKISQECHCRKSLTLYPIELGGHYAGRLIMLLNRN